MSEMVILSTHVGVTALQMGSLTTFAQIKTDCNPKGLFAVSPPEDCETGSFCIATPFEAKGRVRI